MSKELIEGLRNDQKLLDEFGVTSAGTLYAEAANEIERLQAEVAQWKKDYAEKDVWPDGLVLVTKERIAALEAELAQLKSERDAKQWYPLQGPGNPEYDAEIDRLQAENEALKEDAERYRWLRSADKLPFNMMALDMVGEKMDAAIDAARSTPSAPETSPSIGPGE